MRDADMTSELSLSFGRRRATFLHVLAATNAATFTPEYPYITKLANFTPGIF